MTPLPSRPDIAQLKRQAKDLLAAYRRGAPEAVDRFRRSLPAAAASNHDTIMALGLRLHDAQSCIAREHGFASWADLKAFVAASRLQQSDPAALPMAFSRLVYSGDIAGGTTRARPQAAARLLKESPHLSQDDPWIACAAGDIETVGRAMEADAAWIDRPGGPLALTPLIAASHSSLLSIPDHRDRIHRTVGLLLDRGTDPNRTVTKTWATSAEAPPDEWQVSALHGAAGVNFDPDLTRALLAAGADPNDGESLYHSLDNPVCTPLLLEAGAAIAGTNALLRCLDFDDIDTFTLLLSHAGETEAEERDRLLLWAIRRRRSPAHVATLLDAGADPRAKTEDGVSAYIQALRYGLPEVAAVLEREGAATDLDDDDRFVAACARNDAQAARHIQERRPDLPAALDETRLRMLPELAAAGCTGPAMLMADLGWPIDIQGGDWSASALNQAVFRGDATLARHLLMRGASWTERHGYGDNVRGTLSWASLNEPVENGDWVGCAEALTAHGMPFAKRDLEHPDHVIIDGKRGLFSQEVTACLLGDETETPGS